MARAEVLIVAGKPEEAAPLHRQALRLFEECRAGPLAQEARTLVEKLSADSFARLG